MRASPIEKEIREKLSDYLSGTLSIQAFQEWFIPATWNIEKHASENLRKLVYGVELRLAEYTNGHLSPNELKVYLKSLANGKAGSGKSASKAKRKKPKLQVQKRK